MKYQTISLKQFFPAKGAIYCVAIATVIFSQVKITCYFHVWRYHAFARKLTWYFIGVYIIKGIHSLHLHYLYLGILFNSTALILKLELVVVNWFVGNQHTLGVFIWQNFASGRMFLKESMQVVLDHRLFPSSQSPYDTKRPQCGGGTCTIGKTLLRLQIYSSAKHSIIYLTKKWSVNQKFK